MTLRFSAEQLFPEITKTRGEVDWAVGCGRGARNSVLDMLSFRMYLLDILLEILSKQFDLQVWSSQDRFTFEIQI